MDQVHDEKCPLARFNSRSVTTLSRCSLSVLFLSGRSERASYLPSVLARKTESGAVSCLCLGKIRLFTPDTAFGVLEFISWHLPVPRASLSVLFLSGILPRVHGQCHIRGLPSCPLAFRRQSGAHSFPLFVSFSPFFLCICLCPVVAFHDFQYVSRSF